MATELLEGPQMDAGERERASEALPPVPIYPACGKLQKALDAYQAVQAEIEGSRGQVSRAEVDEDKFLGDPSISEKESLERLPEFQSRKRFHEARAKGMEAKTGGLLDELRKALVLANAEIIALEIREANRRSEILTRRIVEAIGGLQPGAVIANGWVSSIVHQSRLMWQVERYRPTALLQYTVSKLEAEGVVSSAEGLLRTAELLMPEIGASI